MKVSVAVPAYNEERNIGLLIDSLRSQRTRRAEIVEIVVIASGCTDRCAVDEVRRHERAPAGLDPDQADGRERRECLPK